MVICKDIEQLLGLLVCQSWGFVVKCKARPYECINNVNYVTVDPADFCFWISSPPTSKDLVLDAYDCTFDQVKEILEGLTFFQDR